MTFEQKIHRLAIQFALSVTSWFRSPKRNAAVGGVADSRHLLGLAVDIVLDDPSQNLAFSKQATSLGLQVIHESDHLHVQQPRNR